jgi:hypothetical protein
MSLFKQMQSGEKVPLGQIMTAQGVISTIRIIAHDADKIDQIHPSLRASIIVCTLAYLRLARENSADPDECGYVMTPTEESDGDYSIEQVIELVEGTLKILRERWPSEYAFAASVMADVEDAQICLMPPHIPGSFENSPELYPPSISGTVTRIPSPISSWGRDIYSPLLQSKDFTIPSSTHVSQLYFEVPPFT